MDIFMGLKAGLQILQQTEKVATSYVDEAINLAIKTSGDRKTALCKIYEEFDVKKLISSENDIVTNIRNFFERRYIAHIFDNGKAPKADFDKHASKIIQELKRFNDPILEKSINKLLIRNVSGADFQIDTIIDVIHKLRGDYSSIGAHSRVKQLLNMIKDRTMPSQLKSLAEHDAKAQALKGYLTTYGKDYHSENIAKHLYKNYYLKYNCRHADTRGLYRGIIDDYDTMVFAENAEEYSYAYAYYIRESLKNWTDAAPFRTSVKLPKQLNITEITDHFISVPDCAGYASYKKDIYLRKPYNVFRDNILDHEITHLNYTCPIKIDDLQAIPWFRKQLEIINCPNIDYALTNGDELVASVMQSDLLKITKEFKDFLITNLKVPEWMFGLKHVEL